MVGVHHNQLGTDPVLRRDPLVTGGHFLWDDPSARHLSHHSQGSLPPQLKGPAGPLPMSLLPARRVAVARPEMAKGCARSVYSPVGSSGEKRGGTAGLGGVKSSLSLAHTVLSAQTQALVRLHLK